MNRPDKAGEPSMEEILASIRQIIAEDPATDRETLAAEPNPLVPQSAPVDRKGEPASAGEARPPMVDRLTDVLKNGPLPPTSPLGSKRPLSFDQDLADMFDEPAAASAGPVPTPKPDLRVPMELSTSVTQPVAQPSAYAAFASKPFMSALANGTETQPVPAAEASATPPPPFGSASPRPAELATPPPARSFGFPPLRKESFYPPQPKTPELPPLPAKPALPATEEGPATTAAPAAAGSGDLDMALERLSDLGAVVPGAAAGPASAEADASASAGYVNGGERPGGRRIRDLGKMPDLSVPEPQAGQDAPSAFASAAPRSEPLALHPPKADPVPAPAPGLAGPLTSPLAGTPEQHTVAAQALDALAQGLAASAAASVMGPAGSEPVIPLTPVAEPQVARAGAVASPQAPAAPQQAAQGRTLEDAVADMLRPMLQQWVAENMPRIIEKALRVEVAKTTKPGSSSSSGP